MTDLTPSVRQLDTTAAVIGIGDEQVFGLIADNPADPTGRTRVQALFAYEHRDAAVQELMLAARALEMARGLRLNPVTCPGCGSDQLALHIPVPSTPAESIMPPDAWIVCRHCHQGEAPQ